MWTCEIFRSEFYVFEASFPAVIQHYTGDSCVVIDQLTLF